MLRPFFSYYGSKWRIGARYPAPCGDTVIEPFAGSAGYSLRWHWKQVVLYDSDSMICGLWDYLIRVPESEIMSLPLVGPGEHLDGFPGLCPEARTLIGFWLQRGGSRPGSMRSPWSDPLGREFPNQWWGEGVRSRIASQLGSIRHWKIGHSSYADVPDHVGTWFVDPPYAGAAGSRYRHGSSGIDYGDLGLWCRARRDLVVVC